MFCGSWVRGDGLTVLQERRDKNLKLENKTFFMIKEEPLTKIRETSEKCGKLNCDKVYVYERKRDKKKFAIHKFTPFGTAFRFPVTHYFIIPEGEYKPGKKTIFETLEEAKKAVADY